MIADYAPAFEDTDRYRHAHDMQMVLERALIGVCDRACLSDNAIRCALEESRADFAAKLRRLRDAFERGDL